MSRILFVLSSAPKTLKDRPTGWFLCEAAHPYYVLSPHFTIDFAAPGGPNPPLDPYSIEVILAHPRGCIQLRWSSFPGSFPKTTKTSEHSQFSDYLAVFYVGGHGPVIDLAKDEVNIELANKFYRAGKVVGAVCHGPAALVGVTGEDGKSIFNGKVLTGFSNDEEKEVGMVEHVPFLLEDRIKSLGGTYEKADKLFCIPPQAKVAHSGNLFTGQNPASARPLAEEILKTLQGKA
ncbi:class I glutamine amidotransferase-like protein [Lactarius deliciosus]|nr:class I glutamine amidotransferase-like protein [Lactarius deliciosus]